MKRLKILSPFISEAKNLFIHHQTTPIILAILLYILIYFLRIQQGGWDLKTEVFKKERELLSQKVNQLLPTPQAQLLSGILLGVKKDLPGNLRVALRDTSTLHITVVSGQNLTILAAFLLSLAGLLGRKLVIFLSFFLIVFYCLLSGAEIPVIRAAIMVTLSYLGVILGRQRDSVWILTVTLGLMLLINPLWIKDLSFQLSALATIGVVVVAPIILRLIKPLPAFIGQDLAITTGAQLMVLPIIASTFHQISYISIIANLMVGWTIPFIMILGSVMIILSLVLEFLAQATAFLVNIFLTYFVYSVFLLSSLDFAWGYVGEMGWIVWMGYYMVLTGVLLAIKKKISIGI